MRCNLLLCGICLPLPCAFSLPFCSQLVARGFAQALTPTQIQLMHPRPERQRHSSLRLHSAVLVATSASPRKPLSSRSP
ncbi:hypothetical protein K438DRAFT_1274694 [Mycena galopus ATCC 62051]|nr:hypothetical protein K438DRAFT_1274694 [Mycena galopus ATCC 62051]